MQATYLHKSMQFFIGKDEELIKVHLVFEENSQLQRERSK